jgi:hypothetical protein
MFIESLLLQEENPAGDECNKNIVIIGLKKLLDIIYRDMPK